LSVLLRFTDSYYPFDIFKLFLATFINYYFFCCNNIYLKRGKHYFTSMDIGKVS